MNSKKKLKIRKLHRWLGVALGLQFFMWTASGLYFSWSDLDQIHGDYFQREPPRRSFSDLIGLDSLNSKDITSLELIDVAGQPHYWINDSLLYDAKKGISRGEGISEGEALAIATDYMVEGLEVTSVELIEEVGAHHEYRGRPLPAYAIRYEHPHEVVAYVSKADGRFQRVRHRNWRWFDFLWMTHTMDYQTRDDFNTLLLRVFSLFGLITVLSGFLLFFTSLKRKNKL